MKFSEYTTKNIESLSSEFSTNFSSGLSSQTASLRKKRYGPNVLNADTTTWVDILFRQFKSAFTYLLFAAAAVAFLLGNTFDGFMIVAFIVINTSLGFYQEYKSERALHYLKDLIVRQCKVLRSGEVKYIPVQDLVPGDVVLLEVGDIVPADLRIIRDDDLYIDESSLTGESIPVRKTSKALSKEESQIYRAENIAFMGTTISEGDGTGVVIFTGKNTEIGNITKLTVETSEISGFEKHINKFSKFILILTLVTLTLVFIAQLVIKGKNVSLPSLALFSIALAVGVIPEALPLVTTFSLTQGALKLAKKKVVAKRLSAIEDLGSIQILCSDKTGTLTQNSLSVSDVFAKDKKKALLYSAMAANVFGSKKAANNSFDLALFKKIGRAEIAKIKKMERLGENPFNPARRRNSVLVKEGSFNILIVRGAQENVLPYVKNIKEKDEKEIMEWILSQGSMGRRVIATAKKKFSGDEYKVKDEESGLELVGLISFSDPIKPTTKDAVKKAQNLGIDIKIITGDSSEVAGAVAFEVGIADSSNEIISGFDFEKFNYEKKLEAVERGKVFARVSPEQKYQIIEMLQKKYTVGYMGDGINDAPALKLANVAIVVNNASDVAREASDLILFQSDLKVIVDGIEEGRRTFVNTSKYIRATLSSNFGNFYAVAIASLLIDYLPMLPVQILLINLLSDFPMISIATDNVDSDEIKKPCSYNNTEIVIMATFLGLASTIFDLILFAVFFKSEPSVLRTAWFIESILSELLLLFIIRTRHLSFKAKSSPSKAIVILTSLAAFFTVLVTFTTIGERVFGFVRLDVKSMLTILVILVTYFVTSELIKVTYYKVRNGEKNLV